MNTSDPYSNPSEKSPDGKTVHSVTRHWLKWVVTVAIAHGLLTWLTIANIPDGAWIMEGGKRTLIETVAVPFALLLNFPAIAFSIAVQLPPLASFSPPFLIANSCLWGLVWATVFTGAAQRRVS